MSNRAELLPCGRRSDLSQSCLPQPPYRAVAAPSIRLESAADVDELERCTRPCTRTSTRSAPEAADDAQPQGAHARTFDTPLPHERRRVAKRSRAC